MLVTESRPRNLSWLHAGPLLYGDWGTSRLYVLGLAFFYTAHASVIHLAAIGALMIAVSWAYSLVCRAYPDGGGVYSAARDLSPTLSVIGATLLLSGYIMTAAISVIEAFHYFGAPKNLTLPLAAGSIVLIGIINWLGAKNAGRFALVIAFGALGVSTVMAVLCLPFFFKGIETISIQPLLDDPADAWVRFTKICLALAGVEAVANMTGLMKKPVAKTAKRTIWPVTIEVVVLNMLFGLALAGLPGLVESHTPDVVTYAGQAPSDEVLAYRDTAMKEVARVSGEHWFGETPGFVASKIAGVTFGLLLLSATNTAIMAMVSVLFAMGQDRELPKALTRLNYSGVPWVGLIVAVVVPIGVILVEHDVQTLAKLYVLGVCGAITTNILSCASNRNLELKVLSRVFLYILGLFLLAVSLTIAITQLESLAFSGGLVMLVLGTRAGLKLAARGAPEPIAEPSEGWLAEARRTPVTLDPGKPRVMLAARGRNQSEFAVDFARSRGAILFAVFVRTIRVMDLRPGQAPRIETDADAQQALGETAVLARAAGVPFIPIYVTSSDIAEEILDHTVTYGCDTLIMGKSKRSLFSRRFEGDVILQVAEDLPDDVALITRSADDVHVPRRASR